MTFYELLLILHIGAAIIWLGAGFLITVLVAAANRRGPASRPAEPLATAE